MKQSNEEIYREFGEKLRELRKSQNMTQKELADVLHVTQGAIVKYEDGSRKVPLDKLKEISEVFSVSVEELLGLEDNVNKTTVIVTDPIRAARHKRWLVTFEDEDFTDEEMNLVVDYAKYLISKRKG